MKKRKIKKFKKKLIKNVKKILKELTIFSTLLVTTKECIDAIAEIIVSKKEK